MKWLAATRCETELSLFGMTEGLHRRRRPDEWAYRGRSILSLRAGNGDWTCSTYLRYVVLWALNLQSSSMGSDRQHKEMQEPPFSSVREGARCFRVEDASVYLSLHRPGEEVNHLLGRDGLIPGLLVLLVATGVRIDQFPCQDTVEDVETVESLERFFGSSQVNRFLLIRWGALCRNGKVLAP